MKKSFPVIVSVLCAVASVSMAQHAVPYVDTYEGYAPGSNLVGSVWQGDTNTSLAVVTSLTYAPPSVGYSVTNPPDHTKVMAFSDGTITNEFDGTSLTLVAIDTMIKPVFAEPPTTGLEAISNSQATLFIDTNGFINIFHAKYLENDEPATQSAWAWSVLSNGVPKLETNKWLRLTMTINYSPSVVMFKVALNGTTISGAEGFTSPTVATTKNGPWFAAPANNAGMLHRVVLSGSGMLDDMVVGTNEVTFPEGPLYAANGVPVSWMETSGLSTNSTNTTWDAVALADDDSDGVTNWQEWVTGTSPTNWSSKLIIVSSTYSNGFPILKWIGSASAQNNYTIQWSSNLLSVLAWTNAIENWPKTDGTNEVTLPAPTVSPAFLRVTVPVP
jgi:hypothetical protein